MIHLHNTPPIALTDKADVRSGQLARTLRGHKQRPEHWSLSFGYKGEFVFMAAPYSVPRQSPLGPFIKDGAPMVLIPARSFMMGSPDGEGDKDQHPRHPVYVDGFKLGDLK